MAEKNNNEEEKKEEDNEIESPKFKQCPYCHNYIEYYGGCKFITCYSFICKSNKYFCWNCNEKLYINDKDKHFAKYGLYSNFCSAKPPK